MPVAHSIVDISTQFQQAMFDAGIVTDEMPIADGQLHRLKIEGDKNGATSGGYILHNDNNPAGCFWSFKLNIKEKWSSKNYKEFTSQERAEHAKRMAEAEKARKRLEAQRHNTARAEAELIWNNAKLETGSHQYLRDKGVNAYGVKTDDLKLLFPLRDTSGTLHSLQTIDPVGVKRFFSGAAKKGYYFSIGKIKGKLIITEGYATGASIHEATGYAVAIAFDAGNLLPVAKALRERFPDINIIIASDNDQWTEGNPGVTKASETAIVVNAKLIIPEFSNTDSKPTDFNDLHQLEGTGAVKSQIKKAKHVTSVSSVQDPCILEEPWPEPQSIVPVLEPVESLPLAIIPEPFQPWLNDVCHRMQCPLDFVAATAIVMTGSIIGTGCGIKPKQKDSWLVIPNLWGGVVGGPSSLKTPSIDEAMRPLSELERLANEDYKEAREFHEVEEDTYQARRKVLKEAIRKEAKKSDSVINMNVVKEKLHQLEKPDSPTRKRFKTNDATIEKMAELLCENQKGLLLFRDELVGLMASWEKEGHQSDRAFYLEAWNGTNSFTTDRIGRGTIFTENLCVSIFGGIQPSKLKGYLKQAMQGYKNDGLLQRFQLLVYPDEIKNWQLVDDFPDDQARERYSDIINNLADMDFVRNGALKNSSARYPYFHFSDEAQQLFNEWLTELQMEKLQSEDNPFLMEHLTKYRSLMPSLSLIFHLIDISDGKSSGDVSFEAAQKAAAWCDYLESHARRIYGLVTNNRVSAAIELLKKIKQGKLQNGFTVREVYKKNWFELTNCESAQDACDELVDNNILRVCEIAPEFGKPGVSGRGKTEYLINPKVMNNG